jgi:hypothetical protein
MLHKILICGSREWNDFKTIKSFLESFLEEKKELNNSLEPRDITVIHGGCKGADSIAGYLAIQLGMSVKVFKADWSKYGKSAGPKRNQQMLDEGIPDLVIAFHNDIDNSKGTKDMITRAKLANVPYKIIKSNNN